MAEEQKNIKIESNTAQTGINQDQSLSQLKPGTLTYALNAMIENYDGNSVNYQNEPGNEFCCTFPDNFVLIGTHFINEQSKHIFLLTNPLTGDSQFGFMVNGDCIYRKLIGSMELGWDINSPIHKIEHRITNCSTEIYWPDNVGRRYLDIDNIPYKLIAGSTLCDPVYSTELAINKLNIQPVFPIPLLKVIDIITGGNIEAGAVQFAIQYSDASSNPFTSYYSVTNPTPISDPSRTTVDFNYTVGKSVVLEIKNLDTTGQFQYFNLAVIKTVNNISSPELVGTYFIDSETKEITYTGQKVDNIRLSINDIFEKFPYYELADDITAVQDVLVWSGLSTIDRVNYQAIASKIELLWETYEIPPDENYSDELNATNLRGFLRDEVYAVEACFLLSRGRQTDGFHIPGRELSNVLDRVGQDVPNTNPDFIGEPEYTNAGVGYAPYWKVYNTGSLIGNSPVGGYKIGNATPYQYGRFAYWESEDVYPCKDEIWGDLSGKPIRHHKFPDVLVSPISKPKISYSGNLIKQDDFVYPIGIKIDPVQIRNLIDSSNLTQQQKDDIVGFKIMRGNRSTNKSIIGKGMLRNVNSYERDEQKFFFPNYPYNDLDSDPFLNDTNNAWAEISSPYRVNVIKFNMPETGIPTYMEVKYTSPQNNREATIKYTTLGERILCSIGQPVILGPGIKNKVDQTKYGPKDSTKAVGVVGLADYDVYFVRNCTPTSVGVKYIDSVEGPSSNWLKASFYGGLTTFLLHVKAGTVPVKDGGKGKLCATLQEEVRSTACKDPENLPGLSTTAPLAFRQVFNSPETSFGQPFLGDILKIENVMYGSGSAHFVEVKDNAKYRLLTAEAQQDALISSNNLGKMTNPFNAAAMFSAYQSYLTIYINGISRKNYAYSFNSIAGYDYNAPVGNSGNKQRTIETSRYLIPGVQSIDGDNINNYQRESSVYIKTDDTVAGLPYPNKVPALPVGVEDNSRFTISESGVCSTPSKEQPISVVSYYASMKNTFINQWGQIYSYELVDTGFQSDFSPLGQTTVFGGDTFINRYAYKTKLPFFIDNRVGAPDDSDIFYDEIGNIAYPKYWHSARSILKDFSATGVGTMSNIISYKAHNFDCPNSQELNPVGAAADTNPDRTFYDGYFYLFAYGVPSFYCESSYNVDLRQATNNREGDFWPHVSTGIPDDWVQESFVPINFDNTYNYNITYSKQNKENTFTHLPPDWTGSKCSTTYPFRAIYSDSQNTDSDNRVNNWLTYRAVSYFDFPQNFGKLISLDGIQNKAVLARFENKTLMYNNLLTIDTSNPQSAYVGNPNMFKGAPPIDFAETDLGHVGSQHKLFLKIPEGQITCDAKRGQIFLITGTTANDIVGFGSGVNKFLAENMSFVITKSFPEVDIDNNFNGVGLHGVFDSKFNRVLITKLDFEPLNNDIKFNNTTKKFYLDDISKTEVDLYDTDYFCNKSWTLSFNFTTKSWISYHSYLPNWYIGDNDYFHSGINGCCDDFDFIAGQLVSNPITTSTTTTKVPTTTSTTTVINICDFAANVTVAYCDLSGEGVITVSPVCRRPENVELYYFVTGYTAVPSGTIVNSTTNKAAACTAIQYINDQPYSDDPVYSINDIAVETLGLFIGSTVYNGTTTDCSFVPNGWYYVEEDIELTRVYNVINGIIVNVDYCIQPTTSTTTTVLVE